MDNILMSNDFSEFMTTEQILDAWSEVKGYILTLQVAVKNRLDELDFDDDTYEYGDSDEIDQLLELKDSLDNIDI